MQLFFYVQILMWLPQCGLQIVKGGRRNILFLDTSDIDFESIENLFCIFCSIPYFRFTRLSLVGPKNFFLFELNEKLTEYENDNNANNIPDEHFVQIPPKEVDPNDEIS